MLRAPCGSGGWGWIDGVGVIGGAPHTCAHTCTCMHTHAHTCMHGKHDNFMQMAAPIGGIHGNSLWCHTHVRVHAHVCIHVHVYVCGGHPLTTPHPYPPPPPHHPHPHPPIPHPQGGDPQNQLKFNSTWTNQDISILFEDLKSVETSPPKGGCIVWWVGGWVDGWGQVKSLKILKLLTESR